MTHLHNKVLHVDLLLNVSCSKAICTCSEQDWRHYPRPVLCFETETFKYTPCPLTASQHTQYLFRRTGGKESVILVKGYAYLSYLK